MIFPLSLRRAFSIVALSTLASIALTSCPPPPPGTGEPIKVVLGTGPEPTEKDLTTVAPDALLRLEARVQSVRILYTDGLAEVPVNVVAGPVTVDLLDLASVSALLSDTTAPARAYTGVELIIARASMVLATAPDEEIALVLEGGGRYRVDFPFEILADSSGILALEFAGIGVFREDDGSYVLSPVVSAALESSSPDTRVEGEIESVGPAASTFVATTRTATYTVNYGGADIFVPGDLDTPGGTPADLVVGAKVAMTGTVGLGDALAPERIEILDDPTTPGDDEGGNVTACLFTGTDPVTAVTVTVTRTRLAAIIEAGGFAGSCDAGEPFTLTYAAGPGGSLSGETVQEVAPGGNASPVTAVPDEGFAFVSWSDGETANPRADRAVGADLSVTANFAALYTLSYAAGPGGTLAGNSTQQVPEGGTGSPVSAVRNDGFVFVQWSDGRTDNPRTDTNVTGDLSVTAEFAEVFQLTYSAGDGGSLEGGTAQNVAAGRNGAPVTAVPNENFIFLEWSDGRTDNPRVDEAVASDISVEAIFVEQFTLTYAAGVNGAIEGETTQLVNAGSSGTPVTAVALEGFGFAGWSDGRFDNPRTDSNVAANVSVTASFTTAVTLSYAAGPNGGLEGAALQIIGQGGTGSAILAVPAEGFGFDRWSDGRTDNPRVDSGVQANVNVTATFVVAHRATYTAGPNGSLTGNTAQLINDGNDGTPVTAVPAEGFDFLNWSDGVTANPRTDLDVTGDITVTANFIELFELTYTAGANGTISGDASQTVRAGDAGEPVTAVANDNFGFVQWSDGRTDNPRTDVNVLADLSVTATFAPVVTLSYAAGENGTLSGETTQVVATGGDGAAVTAVPAEGFLFLMWSDGRGDNPRTDLDVAAGISVTASFFKAPEMIAVPAGSFVMGARDDGDDGTWGRNDEYPRREVTLDAYEIGKFEVTNEDFMIFMNYIHHPSRDLLKRPNGDSWRGFPEHAWFYDTENPRVVFAFALTEDGLDYDQATDQFVTKKLEGLPAGTIYDKATHPVTEPTWYGAVLYANWLSERSGLEPVYNQDTWEADFTKNGYRLPTEAEWERAAAWDGEKHWIYPIMSDTLTTRDRVNFHTESFRPNPDFDNTAFVNPLGIIQDGKEAYTSPVGWFNGVNVSPNGNVQTVNSVSPIGAYDMAGNVVEWCHDWYSETYYSENVTDNPTGPAIGEDRVARGGAWARLVKAENQRTARRFKFDPNHSDGINGFRLAR